MLNKVTLIGHLGKDPVNKIGEMGNSITTFSVATDASFIDRNGMRQEQTEWVHVVCFNKVAENCAHYLHKSSLVYVEGSLQTRKWIDQQNNTRYITEVRAQRVTFLDKKSDSLYGGYQRPQEGYAPQEDYGRPQDPYGRPQEPYGRPHEPYGRPQDPYRGQEYGRGEERYPLDPQAKPGHDNKPNDWRNDYGNSPNFDGPMEM
ncbi:MAG: single-stranded DNA-binding protein, partial [Desulfovibrionaceae bacterium]|nr:single-stranded DNA-binding protein [Desulfovibrionaceae bacterium]